MLTTNILYGIYQEHGLEVLINRLNKLLNINLPKPSKNIKASLEDDAITINYSNPISIIAEGGMFIITTNYETYKVVNYYYGKELIRSVTAFNTSDENVLAIDHLNNGNFVTTRISKTTTKDKTYNQGFYEREITEYPAVPIKASSRYLDNGQDIEEERVVDLAGANLYYHHYLEHKDNEYFQESSMCADIPFTKVSGHLRVPEDLMNTLFRLPQGSIIIRGKILDENNEPSFFYSTTFGYLGNIVSIKDLILDFRTKEFDRKQRIVVTNHRKFNSEVLDKLIEATTDPETVNPNHIPNIQEELNRIKEALLIHEKKQQRSEISPIELMMIVEPDSRHLAYNVYENLPKYEEIIAGELSQIQAKKQAQKPSKI